MHERSSFPILLAYSGNTEAEPLIAQYKIVIVHYNILNIIHELICDE